MNEDLMHKCMEKCWNCRHECQTALYDLCLRLGGKHTESNHVKAMADCIQICQTAADFMARHSMNHEAVCAACAEVCDICARSCKEMGMDECARACQECAIVCRQMSGEPSRKVA